MKKILVTLLIVFGFLTFSPKTSFAHHTPNLLTSDEDKMLVQEAIASGLITNEQELISLFHYDDVQDLESQRNYVKEGIIGGRLDITPEQKADAWLSYSQSTGGVNRPQSEGGAGISPAEKKASASDPTTPPSIAPKPDKVVEPCGNPGLYNAFRHPLCGAVWAMSGVGEALIWIFGQLLALSAWIFEYSLKLSINDMHLLAQMPSISVGWTIARDFANLFFIFILLYIAIGTILDLNGINTAKQVGMVILVALLINFSLAITKVAIDVGNAPALFFYTAVMKAGDGDASLSERIVGSLRIQNITGLAPNTKTGEVAGQSKSVGMSFAKVVIGTFGGVLVILVASFVLIATAAMFLGRALMLIFLMVLSPLAFLGIAFSQMGELWNWWKKELYNQVFFAPAYMAIFAIALILITTAGSDNGLLTNIAKDMPESYGTVSLIMYYFMAIYALTYTLVIAKRFGAWGAGYWDSKYKSYSKSVQGWAGKNFIARPVRSTVGKAAWKASNFQPLRRVDAMLGGNITKGLDSVSNMKVLGNAGYVDARGASIKEKEATARRLSTNTETGDISPEVMEAYAKGRGWAPLANAGKAARKKIEKQAVGEKVKAGYVWNPATKKWDHPDDVLRASGLSEAQIEQRKKDLKDRRESQLRDKAQAIKDDIEYRRGLLAQTPQKTLDKDDREINIPPGAAGATARAKAFDAIDKLEERHKKALTELGLFQEEKK